MHLFYVYLAKDCNYQGQGTAHKARQRKWIVFSPESPAEHATNTLVRMCEESAQGQTCSRNQQILPSELPCAPIVCPIRYAVGGMSNRLTLSQATHAPIELPEKASP